MTSLHLRCMLAGLARLAGCTTQTHNVCICQHTSRSTLAGICQQEHIHSLKIVTAKHAWLAFQHHGACCCSSSVASPDKQNYPDLEFLKNSRHAHAVVLANAASDKVDMFVTQITAVLAQQGNTYMCRQ